MTFTHLPLTLNAVSYNASTGTTIGSITGVHGTLEGASCSLVFDGTGASRNNGTIRIAYVNGTNQLKLRATGGDLHVYQLQGCATFGPIKNGDTLTFSGTGTVAPAQTITSP